MRVEILEILRGRFQYLTHVFRNLRGLWHRERLALDFSQLLVVEVSLFLHAVYLFKKGLVLE